MLEFFAPCARGTESFLAEELRQLPIRKVRPLGSGVAFYGDLKDAYRALLWSRTASRVLLVLDRVPAPDADTLYQACRGIPWEDHVLSEGTIAVSAHGTNEQLRNTQFTAQKVKDALCDRLREKSGQRPSVDATAPDVLVNVSLRGEKATVSIDLAGVPLFKRGYRAGPQQGQAPLKETLAAALLMAAGWPQSAAAGGVLVDPLCGSGTIPIEAGLMAADVAPGIFRERWGFERWLGHDEDLWSNLLDQADQRADVGLALLGSQVRVFASDVDAGMVDIAQANARRAGLADALAFGICDVAKASLPPYAGQGSDCGWTLVTNPPYGERLSSFPELPQLYQGLAAFVRTTPRLMKATVITSDPRVDSAFGKAPGSTIKANNGPLEVSIRTYQDLH